MAYHSFDNVYTKSFTPKEYQVELLEAAKNRNIIVCVGNGPNKTFIALKLIQELSNPIRKSIKRGGFRMVYLTATEVVVSQMAVVFRNLTDLNVGEYIDSQNELDIHQNQVLVMTSDACWNFVQTGQLNFSLLSLLIVDECHHSIMDHSMKKVMDACWHVLANPDIRVVGLTAPLMPGPGGGEPGRLEAEVKRLEYVLHCKAETASDIVSVLRYYSKPKETVLECDRFELGENTLAAELEAQVSSTLAFLEEHRFDPSEIYDNDDFADDLRDIPDPKTDPFNILNDFSLVLNNMGPFCADKAALLLLVQIEKLKVKTPYERHFLLLCIVSTVMLKIRAICDRAFEVYDEKERIYKFSSPKILKLIEVLRQFKPKKPAQNDALNEKPTEGGEIKENSSSTKFETNSRLGKKLETVNEECVDQSSETVNSKEDDKNVDNLLENERVDNLVEISSEHCGTTLTLVQCKSNFKNSQDNLDDENCKRNCNGSQDNLEDENFKHNCNGSQGNLEEEGCQLNCNSSQSNSEKESCKLNNNGPQHSLKYNESFQKANDCSEEPLTNGFSNVIEENCSFVCEEERTSHGDNLNGVNDENRSVVSNHIDDNNLLLPNGCDNLQVLSKEEKLKREGECFLNGNLDPSSLLDVTIQSTVDDRLVVNEESVLVGEGGNDNDSGVASCDRTDGMSNDEQSVIEETSSPWEFQGRGGRWRGRGRGWRYRGRNQQHPHQGRSHRFNQSEDADALCALVLVEQRFTAKILSHFLNDVRRNDPELSHVSSQFTVSKIADPVKEPREAEIEHRKQEEVLKRFRMRECNVLVGTSLLEDGIDLPKCNLVVRYNVSNNYRSYAHSKGRARAPESYYVHLIEKDLCDSFITDLAQFIEIEKMLLRRCANQEPSEEEEREADLYSSCVPPYKPKEDADSCVTMATAVVSVNRYCAKLPSDTFTRLTPQASMKRVFFNDQDMYVCTIRLPINSPVKQEIVGHPMPTRVLARRIAAMETCRTLYLAKELDDNLQPIGKERFQMLDSPVQAPDPEEPPPQLWDVEPRPGTTKRRQYYYKRIAGALNDCRPIEGTPAMLYHLDMILTCPLPEEQNTRGRKLHPPEDSPQGFGILTLKTIPKICPFPIFTRSGEVRVSLNLCDTNVSLTESQMKKILTFLNFTFTSVLRLQKYLMLFDENARENSYLIVPTRRNEHGVIEVDWDFLDVIFVRRKEVPHDIPDEERKDFMFDPAKYMDAVVMPWYRNQDQPQYFYVAEICNHLNPKSSFPGCEYKTFEEYYYIKYGYMIQNSQQPLLDVDHTSARLNFLTPRYVNRKGVALPTSSEETKRAKRENLEQKQILVPELCMVHPFPASLWRKAVCLPCILYRINALLLADEIRTTVSREIGLGMVDLDPDFNWKPLDFGWSLADVLKKSKEDNERLALAKMKSLAKAAENRDNDQVVGEEAVVDSKETDEKAELEDKEKTEIKDAESKEDEEKKDDGSECKKEEREEEKDEKKNEKDAAWMEIGTWSNEMAIGGAFMLDEDTIDQFSSIRYGSPSWEMEAGMRGGHDYYDSDDSPEDSEPDYSSSSSDDDEKGAGRGGLRIMFKSEYLAEAIEDGDENEDEDKEDVEEENREWQWHEEVVDDLEDEVQIENKKYREAVVRNEENIRKSGTLLRHDQSFVVARNESAKVAAVEQDVPSEKKELGFVVQGYSMPEKIIDCDTSDSGISLDRSMNASTSSLGSSSISSDSNVQDEVASAFSFDSQPELEKHPGPSPSVLLQALTMSNANDGINLERLETIGDSFLKFAITTYLYCMYESVHEGKLSHLRSKQVSNLNLYRLGRAKIFGESMIASKFEPHDNWLPPCYFVPKQLERALIEAGVPAFQWNQTKLPALRDMSTEEINAIVKERGEQLQGTNCDNPLSLENLPCFVPYNLITQHSIPDKSIADCVEALIGAYLIECGPRGALIFMSWLGIKVLPYEEVKVTDETPYERPVGSHRPDENKCQIRYGSLSAPHSPLLRHVTNPEGELQRLLAGFDVFERSLQYRFQDRSYLLQAMTHASYHTNTLTDCYQRLEFLGDAVLDYLITRHLYEDKRQHCPGDLTDLRSALVNNTIFASLAVRHGFHKFFCHLSPGLSEVIERFVRIQEENGHMITEECYLIGEEECEEVEDVEVPKALGDVFESVAGGIFLDSGMSLDAVWMVYYHMMKNEIDQFSTNVPKSPIRELLELEPETAKFGKPEKLADGRRVRVNVEVFGKGTYKGIGRNYRIAKCTAAKCALKQLKKQGLLAKKFSSRW